MQADFLSSNVDATFFTLGVQQVWFPDWWQGKEEHWIIHQEETKGKISIIIIIRLKFNIFKSGNKRWLNYILHF